MLHDFAICLRSLELIDHTWTQARTRWGNPGWYVQICAEMDAQIQAFVNEISSLVLKTHIFLYKLAGKSVWNSCQPSNIAESQYGSRWFMEFYGWYVVMSFRRSNLFCQDVPGFLYKQSEWMSRSAAFLSFHSLLSLILDLSEHAISACQSTNQRPSDQTNTQENTSKTSNPQDSLCIVSTFSMSMHALKKSRISTLWGESWIHWFLPAESHRNTSWIIYQTYQDKLHICIYC